MSGIDTYLCGWTKAGHDTPEHEVGFKDINEAFGYVRSELSWLAADVPTTDPLGNEAMAMAKHLQEIHAYVDVLGWEWPVGKYVYYVRKNPLAAKLEKLARYG